MKPLPIVGVLVIVAACLLAPAGAMGAHPCPAGCGSQKKACLQTARVGKLVCKPDCRASAGPATLGACLRGCTEQFGTAKPPARAITPPASGSVRRPRYLVPVRAPSSTGAARKPRGLRAGRGGTGGGSVRAGVSDGIGSPRVSPGVRCDGAARRGDMCGELRDVCRGVLVSDRVRRRQPLHGRPLRQRDL